MGLQTRDGLTVCIHGVGRSGTKIVQLATCLGLARAYGRCDTVYEPFHWAHRGCTVPSAPGIREHRRLPLFLSDTETASVDSRYLRAKMAPRGNVPLVGKFIRGNGRIGLIDRLVAPDRTIVVLRSLPHVLQSVRRCPFDLLGKGQHYPSDATRLVDEITATCSLPVSRAFVSRCASTEDLNALWWLAMTEAAFAAVVRLRAAGRPVLLLDHGRLLERSSERCRELSDFLGLPPFEFTLPSLRDAWIRDETLLRTDPVATTPRSVPETEDDPWRERVFPAPDPPPRLPDRSSGRPPAADLEAHPLYREMNEAVSRMLDTLPT